MKRKIFSVLIALVLVCSFSLVMAVPAGGVHTPPGIIYVDATFSGTEDGGLATPFNTIGEAITHATAGDTISVAAGTYAESLTVNKEISIIGAGPTTIIDPAVDADGITITADNVLIQDLTVSTENTADPVSNIAILIRGTDGVEVNNVTVLTTGDSAMGVWIGGSGEEASSNLSILDCDITITDKGTAIYGAKIDGTPHSNWTITGNTLSAAHVPGVNLELYDVNIVLVDDNTFLTTGSVNLVYSSEYSNVGSATISNNSFAGSGDIGGVTPTIWVESDFQGATWGDNTAVDGVAITGNTFNAWANAAIQIGEGVSGYDDVSNVVINSNIFNMTTAYSAILDFTDLATGTGNTFNVSSPATIQGAIDSAFAGDTIVAQDGTYIEDLTVNIANLTLRSLNGKAVTTIQLVDGVGIDIQGGASNFTLGGASGQGFEIKSSSGTSTTFNIQLANAPSGVEISYNTIDTTGDASMGISVGAAGASGLTISNNTFTAEDGDGSIFGPDVVNVTVSSNTFTGPATPTWGYAIEFAGVTGTSTISGNTISNYANGIFMFGASVTAQAGTTGVSGLTISGNTISGCTKGIRLGYLDQSEDMDDVTVENNTLSNNVVGLYVSDGAHVLASNFVIRYNAFINNTGFGLQNAHDTEQVTAEGNWWNNVAGPEITTNPYDAHNAGADSVTTDVDYSPWMIHIELVSGWNIWSTPIALDASSNTIANALNLWDNDIGSLVIGWYFDQIWKPLLDSTVIEPMQPVYLKMTAPATVDVVLSTDRSATPFKTLYAGWNLIGLAELYDVAAEDALASAYYVAGANNIGYSQAVSPPVGQIAWSVVRGPAIDTLTGKTMSPVEGYWLFMVNQGTLAGFTSTPIEPIVP